jgi:hypothetical protein
MADSGCTARLLRLSIVIPTPRDTAALEATLVSVLERRPIDCEIVVALGCDYDDPWNIAEEVRFVRAPRNAGLVGCINSGVAASTGDVIHVLAAGWLATDGWTDGPLAHFDDAHVAAVVPVGVAADDSGRVVSAGVCCAAGGRRIEVAETRRWRKARVGEGLPAGSSQPMGPVLEAGFWRAATFALAGTGLATACGDESADADTAITLARSGGRTVLEPDSRVVAAARRRLGGFRAGLTAERLFWRSLAGQSFIVAIVMHMLEVVRHAVARAPLGTLSMLLGRLVGIVQFGGYVPRFVQLRRLMARAAAERRPDASGNAATGDGTGDATGVETDVRERTTIRIDAGHAGVGRPRAKVATPLRKSA